MCRLLIETAMCGMVTLSMAAGPAAAAGWADALFSERGHDFGPVPRGAKVQHDFILTNRLGEAITIVNIRASCGCTSGKASASQVPPGQAAIVEAEMDTRNFVGPKATALFVTVRTAGGREAEVRLGVSSTILSDVVLNPGTIDFGTVARGQTPTQTLTIDRVGMPDWRAERMVSASRSIHAALVETVRKASSVSYTLTVTLKPEAPAGLIRDEIRILTNDPETASILVLVSAQVRGELVGLAERPLPGPGDVVRGRPGPVSHSGHQAVHHHAHRRGRRRLQDRPVRRHPQARARRHAHLQVRGGLAPRRPPPHLPHPYRSVRRASGGRVRYPACHPLIAGMGDDESHPPCRRDPIRVAGTSKDLYADAGPSYSDNDVGRSPRYSSPGLDHADFRTPDRPDPAPASQGVRSP